jgi:hypothetical protein
LCCIYDYFFDAQKLKLFLNTLKESSLRWFMGLGGNSISSWDVVKQAFLNKYQTYYQDRDIRGEIFKIAQKKKESLGDYVEWFQYNVRWSNQQ